MERLWQCAGVECRRLIPALNAWEVRVYTIHVARLIDTQFHGHGCMNNLTTQRCIESQATWVIDVLGLFFDILSRGACTIRNWQTSGRLVQE